MATEYRVVDWLPKPFSEVEDELEYGEQALIRYVDGEPEELVYVDCFDCPEDMSLSRDLLVFVGELNHLAGLL